ncbi:MAG: M20 family metallopeptidase [Terrimicrobiaceae bacterium]|nr:M20 family metallopeptidase [Terrimicrobiaceae bacterium]
MSPVVSLTADLVRIPSVNPDGDPGTGETGERACAEKIAEILTPVAANVELREVLPDRPNVVARFPSGRPDKPRLLLAPHTDTVSVVGMTIDPFGAEIRDGRLYGRGATDTKGPMAAMLAALIECRDILPDLSHEIWFAGLVGEEAGQHGAKALAAEEHFDFVIAGEPTDLQTVHTHKGSQWTQLRTRGHAVHASRPDEGENAIYKMVRAISAIETDVATELRLLQDPVLGHATVSVGVIRGGSKVNIVPDECLASVDMRTIPGQPPGLLERVVLKAVPDIEFTVTRAAPLQTAPDHPLIRQLAALGARPVGAPWFCDAAVFGSQGCPAVALGPGSIAQAHTADEFIELADLEAGATFFTRFLQSLRA